MDALLRYTLYGITISILLLEVGLMVTCCLLIILIKSVTRRKQQKRDKNAAAIRALIDKHLLNDLPLTTLSIPNDLNDFQNVLECAETYDHLFTDERWQNIKEKIFAENLTPFLSAYATSFSWVKRQLAARAMLLCPHKAQRELLEKLLDDNRFLVRVTAATCITRISDQLLFEKVIKKMSMESPHSQFPYRDALIQVDEEKFRWIEKVLRETNNIKTQAICLDILSERYSNNAFDLVQPFLHCSDITCRTLAIKVLGSIPLPESKKILLHRLEDSDWNIRAEAIMSLEKLHALEAIPQLREALNDPVWWVRLKAAMALKSIGKDGLDVLNAKLSEKGSKACEIAQYALALP
ncbi:HEAT repeat domain-containing protein [Estrella lausannensis]|uniref:Putative membrane protein n=1 Tax=Estrella lausannensis TaxID=483423 RepID=A0A0H5DQ01_9BACT|nr:HEAT repeat domain-containing protein [Estrella lausannensis]CRX38108.1 putative membrane protein [Estrella lausannensis]